MATIKDSLKDLGISLLYDLLLVGLAVCWIVAILLVILDVSLWIVLGLFIIGSVMFLISQLYFKEDKAPEEKIESEEAMETEKPVIIKKKKQSKEDEIFD